METLYLITDYAELEGVLDIFKDLSEAENNFFCWSHWYKETHLFKLQFDKVKYDYSRDYYNLNVIDYKTKEIINPDNFKKLGISLKKLLTPNHSY